MGSDPAPLMTNLFLVHYAEKAILTNLRENEEEIRKRGKCL